MAPSGKTGRGFLFRPLNYVEYIIPSSSRIRVILICKLDYVGSLLVLQVPASGFNNPDPMQFIRDIYAEKSGGKTAGHLL